MKKAINLLLFIGILLVSCEKKETKPDNEEEDVQEHVDTRLKGTWQNQSGNAVYNGDEKGIYLKSTTHAAWLSAIQGGLVKYGDAYIKNLRQKSDNEYACDILWFTRTDGVVTEVRYSSKSTITISADGKRIDISSYGPWDDDLMSSVLLKQEGQGDETEEEDNSQDEVVYIGGTIYSSTYNGIRQPAYCVNDKLIRCESSYHAIVTSMFVSGTDVYLAGDEAAGAIVFDNAREPLATYWKNGKRVRLSNSPSTATAIFVDGDDVFVAGTVNNKPVYWKNNVIYHLPFSGLSSLTEMRPCDIMVSGNDVHIVGNNGFYGQNAESIYWKNGVAVGLSKESEYSGVFANTIYIRGSDVYIAGADGYRAKYWKNGTGTYLDPPDVPGAWGLAIYVSDKGDIYVAGQDKYWKNGVIFNKFEGATNYRGGFAVLNDDVYILGTEGYWKNDVFTNHFLIDNRVIFVGPANY